MILLRKEQILDFEFNLGFSDPNDHFLSRPRYCTASPPEVHRKEKGELIKITPTEIFLGTYQCVAPTPKNISILREKSVNPSNGITSIKFLYLPLRTLSFKSLILSSSCTLESPGE